METLFYAVGLGAIAAAMFSALGLWGKAPGGG